MRLLIRAVLTAAALAVATALVPGIQLGHGSTTSKVLTLLAVAVIFGLVNAIIKPVVKAVGCLFYVLTLGLIGLVVNGLLLWLTSWVAGSSRCRSTSPASGPRSGARSSSAWSAGCSAC